MSRNPFQDLQGRRGEHDRRSRLISEGGDSHAGNGASFCRESSPSRQTCSSESLHPAYRSTTGACSMFGLPDSTLFSVPRVQAEQLDKGSIPTLLRDRFRRLGVALSDGARVQVRQSGRIWSIIDRDGRYAVRKLCAHLIVSEDKSGPV